uniref:G_PROTEIN_RECEP_F1_2 domain-containing protein n=1 Tax=Meloidogyne incognita TaxID=6306 RepID=A0A914LB25_MELIC
MEKAAGGLANSILMATMPICLVLSLNRLLVFLPSKLDDAREERLFNWLIALSLLHGLPFFIIYLTPHSTIAFRYYTWDYVTIYNNSTWTWVGTSTAILPLPYITLTLFVYLAIFGVLILQRRKITSTKPKKITPTICPTPTATMYPNNTNLHRNQKNEQIPANVIPIEWSAYKPPQPPTTKNISPSTQNPIQHLIQHERRLLFQALVQFGVEFSLCLIWFYQMIGAPIPEGVVFNAFINWYWIFYNGFRPLVYLAMNKTVRKRLLALWLNQPQATLVDFGKLQRGAAPQGIRATPRLFSQNKQTQNYASGRMS